MNWQLTLESSLAQYGKATLSIDGVQWDVRQDNTGNIQFANEFGRQETFYSFDQLENAIYSWYENASVMIVS